MNAPHLAIVGGGIAGLYAAAQAVNAGLTVTLLAKGSLAQSNTFRAQGGISAVLPPGQGAPGDTVADHVVDTLTAGAGLCDADAVSVLCTEAARDIAALEELGVQFDMTAVGSRALGLEAAHSAARILHAGGDATGAGIATALINHVQRLASAGALTLLTESFVTELITTDGAVAGVRYTSNGAENSVKAEYVLLATGGAGQMFERTTNPAVATGDGVALAWRVGAVVGDAEFFQFHPTSLVADGNFMISEAVRGEGAVLRDAAGERFMLRYHPDAELAPRDVVARSISAHLRAIGAAPEATVFLDATGLEAQHGEGFLAQRFPSINRATQQAGFDWRTQWLHVLPAAHYWMGGVATDLQGRTSVPGLLAAGEVACTGVHGANRLASNSLLEGLVFARRAVSYISSGPALGDPWPSFSATPLALESNTADEKLGEAIFDRAELQGTMFKNVGVERDEAGLSVAAKQLRIFAETAQSGSADTVADRELGNLRLCAALVVHAAAHRAHSVGAHFRTDFPTTPHNAAARRRQFWYNPSGTATSSLQIGNGS